METGHRAFAAQAFHPDFGSEVLEGELSFHGWALRFEAGETCFEIPVERLVTDLGSDDDDRIFFSDPQQPGLRIAAMDASILEARELPQVARMRDQLSARLSRSEHVRRLKVVGWVVGGCAVAAWLAMLGLGVMVRAIVARASPQWEQKLGAKALEELRESMVFVTDTNRVARLGASAQPLLRALPGGETNYQFYIVDMEIPNAMALPGGHIIVTTGMLKLAERREELLGAIAHEVAHVARKHSLQKMVSAGGPIWIFQTFFSDSGGMVAAFAGVSAVLAAQSFSQEYEMEADDVGWDYLVAANIDPRGMTEVFRKLDAYASEHKLVNLVPQAFNSHPSTRKRIARLEAKWHALPDKARFESPAAADSTAR